MHKLCWGGFKRFTSGHGIAGMVSGVVAATHCGDEVYFSVGMEVSLRDQRSLPLARYRYAKAISTPASVVYRYRNASLSPFCAR